MVIFPSGREAKPSVRHISERLLHFAVSKTHQGRETHVESIAVGYFDYLFDWAVGGHRRI